MKTIRFTLLGSIASFLILLSCQKNAKEIAAPGTFQALPSVQHQQTNGNPYAYVVTLESRTHVDGNWVWIWSVRNSNPGNGHNGTFQNLSHWGLQFDPQVDLSTIIAAGYSADGSTWTGFNPVVAIDGSQNCMIDPVLKFDFGTEGANKSYYKIVTTYDYSEGSATGFYKSGNVTGCAVFTFNGISSGVIPDR